MAEEVFDKIARDWQIKRQKPWRPFVEVVQPILDKNYDSTGHGGPGPGIAIDLGAGSGRHQAFLGRYCREVVALDQSRAMLRLHPGPIKVQADLTALPFRPRQFALAAAIASLHHVKGQVARELAVAEIHALLMDDALIVATAWRFKQKKFLTEFTAQLEREMAHTLKHGVPPGPEVGDVTVPWRVSQGRTTVTVDRFYHLFRAREFRRLFQKFHRVRAQSFGAAKEKTNFLFVGTKGPERLIKRE